MGGLTAVGEVGGRRNRLGIRGGAYESQSAAGACHLNHWVIREKKNGGGQRRNRKGDDLPPKLRRKGSVTRVSKGGKNRKRGGVGNSALPIEKPGMWAVELKNSEARKGNL